MKVDCSCGSGIRRYPCAAQQLTQDELRDASARYSDHQWHCGGHPLNGGAYTYPVEDPPVAALRALPPPAAWNLDQRAGEPAAAPAQLQQAAWTLHQGAAAAAPAQLQQLEPPPPPPPPPIMKAAPPSMKAPPASPAAAEHQAPPPLPAAQTAPIMKAPPPSMKTPPPAPLAAGAAASASGTASSSGAAERPPEHAADPTAEQLTAQMTQLTAQLMQLQAQVQQLTGAIAALQLQVPNIPSTAPSTANGPQDTSRNEAWYHGGDEVWYGARGNADHLNGGPRWQ